MKTTGFQTFLYSIGGVLALFVIIVTFNWLAARGKVRVDLTEERAYTLSKGTKDILAKLDTPVQIRFYCTQGENAMPIVLKNHAKIVEDLLDEYRQASNGHIEVQKLDPQPDSDAEDSARLDGVESLTVGRDENVYLGLSVSMLDQKEAIAFLDPRGESNLEYQISRAISRVASPEKPVIGLLTTLPLEGQMSPMMMRGGRGMPAWFVYTDLKRTYNVKKLEMTVDKIPDDIKVLVVIHPKGISDGTQYAIDQFVLRGGKLIAFLDPLSVFDPASGGMMGGPSGSSMDKLLKGWGLAFDSTKVLADLNYVAQGPQGRAPAVLALTENALNKSVLTNSMTSFLLPFAGVFTGVPADGLKETVLLKSSKDSQLIDPMTAQMDGEQVIKEFHASGVEHKIALQLDGHFKTAFPDGKPKAPDAKPDEKKEDGAKPEEKKPDKPEEAGLKESSKDTSVILVGDADMLGDQVSIQIISFGNQKWEQPRNNNLAFAHGAIDQLSGDSSLIAIRSRTSRDRPFTVVNKLQAEAEANFQSKIQELEQKAAETQRKLSELEQAKSGAQGQRVILSPEQQAEIDNFRKVRADVNKQLKEEKKRLRRGVESLQNSVQFWNILGVPIVVIVFGIVLAAIRRSKQAAT